MIKIVTVYNSLNPGSFLQATALADAIRERYNSVTFFDTGAKHPFLSGIKLSLNLLKHGKFSYAAQQFIMPFKYQRLLSKYGKTPNVKDDIIVLGSDEIWNVARRKIAKHKEFWGVGFEGSKCISYAASLNEANESDIQNYDYIVPAISRLTQISVRDNHSKNVLEKYTSKDITIVTDPTYFYTKEYYRSKYTKKLDFNTPYILVYGSNRYLKDDIETIVQFSKEHHLPIYSYYFYHEWADKIFFGDPYEFLQLIDNAKYVFTSTFHGTVFSIMFNKEFVIFGKNKKVEEVLEQFALQDKHFGDKTIATILNSEYEYNRINELINIEANKSKEFLFASLEAVENERNEKSNRS